MKLNRGHRGIISKKKNDMKKLSTFISLPFKLEHRIPARFTGDDTRFPEELLRRLLHHFSHPGDSVLDPFLGLGTTCFVCEQLGRIPFGVEVDPERYEWVTSKVQQPNNLILGDAGKLRDYGIPKCDFCVTSPPYMPRHHRWNPLFQGNPRYAGYSNYLKRIGEIFQQVSMVVKRNRHVVIEVSNLKGKVLTPLAWDIAEQVSSIMKFEGEIVIGWEGGYGYEYDHSYCLIFKNTKQANQRK